MHPDAGSCRIVTFMVRDIQPNFFVNSVKTVTFPTNQADHTHNGVRFKTSRFNMFSQRNQQILPPQTPPSGNKITAEPTKKPLASNLNHAIKDPLLNRIDGIFDLDHTVEGPPSASDTDRTSLVRVINDTISPSTEARHSGK